MVKLFKWFTRLAGLKYALQWCANYDYQIALDLPRNIANHGRGRAGVRGRRGFRGVSDALFVLEQRSTCAPHGLRGSPPLDLIEVKSSHFGHTFSSWPSGYLG